MDKMLNAETSPDARKKQKADYKAEVADLLAQMRVIDEHVRQTQAETAQLRAETWVMLDRMKAELNIARNRKCAEGPAVSAGEYAKEHG